MSNNLNIEYYEDIPPEFVSDALSIKSISTSLRKAEYSMAQPIMIRTELEQGLINKYGEIFAHSLAKELIKKYKVNIRREFGEYILHFTTYVLTEEERFELNNRIDELSNECSNLCKNKRELEWAIERSMEELAKYDKPNLLKRLKYLFLGRI